MLFFSRRNKIVGCVNLLPLHKISVLTAESKCFACCGVVATTFDLFYFSVPFLTHKMQFSSPFAQQRRNRINDLANYLLKKSEDKSFELVAGFRFYDKGKPITELDLNTLPLALR